jgi:hypothetical protein
MTGCLRGNVAPAETDRVDTDSMGCVHRVNAGLRQTKPMNVGAIDGSGGAFLALAIPGSGAVGLHNKSLQQSPKGPIGTASVDP